MDLMWLQVVVCRATQLDERQDIFSVYIWDLG